MTVVSNTPLDNYDVETTQAASGRLIQKMFLPPWPEVPLATSIDITYDSGNPTVIVFKNTLGTTLATKTITYVDGNPTNISWS